MKQTIRIFMLLAAIVVETGETWAQEGYDYIDADGVLKNTATDNIAASNNVIVLDGTETTLGVADQETWYIAQGTLNYTSGITFNGNAHLILADDAVMSVNGGEYGIRAGDGTNAYDLYIHGQSTYEADNCGKLNVTATTTGDVKSAAILAEGEFAIYGGNVTATANTGDNCCYGIEADKDVAICGAAVTASGKNSSSGTSGIRLNNGDLTIIDAAVTAGYASDTEDVVSYYGIFCSQKGSSGKGNLTIKNSDVTAGGKDVGLEISNNITVSGTKGTVNAYGKSQFAIHSYKGHITLGDENTTGVTVNATCTDYEGVFTQVGDIVINGTTVNATGKETGIHSEGGITINGNVTAKSTDATEEYSIGIAAIKDLTIIGGQIDAFGYKYGLWVENLTLGWSKASDYFKANNYNVTDVDGNAGTVKTADKKQFAAYSVDGTSGAETFSATYGSANGSVTLDGDQVTAIGGMMLRPYNITSVDYVDADGTLKNTATDNNTANDNITLLTGVETQLGTGTSSKTWYLVNSAGLKYTRGLSLSGDVHLILADGASMTVTKNDAGGAAISGGVGLTIYGQDGGTGTLTAIGKDGGGDYPGYALSSSSVTINSGRANFQVSGGTMSFGSGIYTTNMEINGGQVTAAKTTYGDGIYCTDIKIGWNRMTDFINVDRYGGKVTIDDGQIFAAYDGNDDVEGFASGTIEYTSDNGINGRTLRPVDGAPLSLGSNLSLESAMRGTTALDPTGLPTMMTVNGDTYTIYQPNDELTFKVADDYSADGFVYVNGFPEGTTFSNVDGATSRERTFGMSAAPVRLEAVTLTEFTTPAAIDNNGTAQTPATVTGMDATTGNKYTLTAGTDFTVSGMQKDGTAVSEMTDAGLYALTLTGIGPSFGTMSDVYYGIYTVDSEVPYLTWSDTEKKLVTWYTEPKVKVWQLLGHETELGTDEMDSSWNPVETWYIAKGTLNFTKPITIKGPTHIILAEGDDLVAMTVKVTTYGEGAFESPQVSSYESLFIHAQSIDGTQGSLAVNATTGEGVHLEGDYTQNGGNVSITSDFDGLYAGNVNFNGGTLNIEANKVEDDDYNHAAIYGNYTNINGGKLTVKSTKERGVLVYGFTMKGGQVEASGDDDGIKAVYMTIDWMNASDYIKASSYGCAVDIADGKYFTFDGISTLVGFPVTYEIPLRGHLSEDDINWQDYGGGSSGIIPPNTKLVPALPIVGGVPYIGYIGSRGNWALPAGIKAFVPTDYDLSNKSVTVTEVADVPDGKYVIFGNAADDNSDLPATFFLTGKESATEGGYTEPGDHFIMADGHTKISEYIEQVLGAGTSANEAVVFTLTTGAYRLVNIDGKNSGVLTITSNNIPVAGQMLFIISKWELMQALKGIGGGGSGIRQRTISIDFDGTTGIRDIEYEPLNMDPSAGSWFTLDGRKLDKAPTKKGIYIHNGKKEVVR